MFLRAFRVCDPEYIDGEIKRILDIGKIPHFMMTYEVLRRMTSKLKCTLLIDLNKTLDNCDSHMFQGVKRFRDYKIKT